MKLTSNLSWVSKKPQTRLFKFQTHLIRGRTRQVLRKNHPVVIPNLTWINLLICPTRSSKTFFLWHYVTEDQQDNLFKFQNTSTFVTWVILGRVKTVGGLSTRAHFIGLSCRVAQGRKKYMSHGYKVDVNYR